LTESVQIRAAEPADAALLFSWIVELAEYERAAGQVRGSQELLADALFGAGACVEAVIAERAPGPDRVRGVPAGFALFFGTFSTWLCRPGLWLEDLYVPAADRRRGVARALLVHVARVAVSRRCARVEWAALHWNTPALSFYESLGAHRLEQWQTLRLEGQALERVAAEPAPR
jgi:GNAT superfamily N-acetyltransferase